MCKYVQNGQIEITKDKITTKHQGLDQILRLTILYSPTSTYNTKKKLENWGKIQKIIFKEL